MGQNGFKAQVRRDVYPRPSEAIRKNLHVEMFVAERVSSKVPCLYNKSTYVQYGISLLPPNITMT